MTHALLSPSGASRWMACPGSVALESACPDIPTEYKDDGTGAHLLSAMCLVEGRMPPAYEGRRVGVAPHRTVEVTAEMVDAVQLYVDFVRSLEGEKFYEIKVPIDHITGEEGAEGTADAVILTPDGKELVVVDLKYGRGVPVSAERNPQAMLYALGALRKYDVLDEIERIRIFIHQPRVNPVPSEWDCSVAELRAFAVEAKEHAHVAEFAYRHRENWMGKDDSYLSPGDEQCRFCKAKATCPALAAHVETTVGADFETLSQINPGPDSIERVALDLVPAQISDAALLAEKMRACDLLEDWIKAVRAEVERLLLAGSEVPGFKLVQGRAGNRAWSDPTAAEAMMKETFRLKIEEMYDLKLINPTSAEKLTKAGVIGPRQWPKLQGLVVRAEGAKSVAPVSDPRPALVITPTADDFEEHADLV